MVKTMNKISPNMLRNICSVKSVCNMFLDFDNNKDYFDEGKLYDYLNSLQEYIKTEFISHLDNNNFILDEEFISSVITIYKKYYFSLLDKQNKNDIVSSPVVRYLKDYKNMLNIDIIKKEGPCAYESKDIRNNAIKIAGIQLDKIEKFYTEIDYEKKLENHLTKFDIYLSSDKKMTQKDYYYLIFVLENAGSKIPQRYVDLFFKNVIKYNRVCSIKSVTTALESIILNFANSKYIDAYFNCNFTNKDAGQYKDGIVSISLDEVCSFVEDHSKNVEFLFNVLFQQLSYLIEDNLLKTNKVYTYNEIKMLKDSLLQEMLNNNNVKNKNFNFSHEINQRSMGTIYSKRYFDTLGIKTENKLENQKENIKNSNKLVGYKQCKVDYLFDELILNVIENYKQNYSEDIFKKYPVLSLIYTKESKRYSSLDLFKKREENILLLNTSTPEEKEELQTSIENLNVILYNQELSYINAISDYKELSNNNTLLIDSQEKEDYLENYLYSMTKSKNKILFKQTMSFLERVTNLPVDNIEEFVEATIKTGDEMIEIFRQMNKNHKSLIKEKKD